MAAFVNNQRWSMELARVAESKRSAVVLLRWVLVIASSAVILFRPHTRDEVPLVHCTALLLIGSNLLLRAVPARFYVKPWFDSLVVVIDIGLVSLAIFLTGSVRGEFYLLYFLVVMIAAIGETLATILLSALLVMSAYLFLVWNYGGGITPDVLIRIPFVFIVAIFYGYFAQLVRSERKARVRFQAKLSAAKQIREIGIAFARTLDRKQILQSLTDGARDLCGASYTAVIDRSSGHAIAESGDIAHRPTPDQINELFSNVARRIGFRELGRELSAEPKDFPHILSRDGAIAEKEGQAVVRFVAQGSTLLPMLGGEISNLYLFVPQELEPDFCEYAGLLLTSATLALSNAGQYQALVHEAENRQHIARQLSEALNFSSQFTANMSHEIRTPLLSLIGFGELLESGGYGALSPEQQEIVGRMVRNGQSLLELINDVLDLAKLDAGAVAIKLEPRNVSDFVEEIVETCTPLLKNKPVTLSGWCDSGGFVSTDWGLVRQIALNLVSNAVKFTMKGTVEIIVGHDPARGELYLRVNDTGIGIDPERLSEIFQPFRQLEESYTKRFAGTGLGLAISRRYAELLKGTIQVESTPGVGSTFRLAIPAGQPSLNDAVQSRRATSHAREEPASTSTQL